MLYHFINDAKSPNGRRLRALLIFLTFPLLLIVGFIVGTVSHLWDFTKLYAADLVDLFVECIPETIRDLIFTIRTGKQFS